MVSLGNWNPTENCFLITYHFIHHVGVLGHANLVIVNRHPPGEGLGFTQEKGRSLGPRLVFVVPRCKGGMSNN
jgi:hypothetical protein